ncbi:hypothetical protein ACEUZ9_005485 [Paracoccus litorisediminis]|uniref:hypothetical protein n=1 Tax=Paracoccus litorisediminis TaxID=2006130 RepID=UPI003732B1C9
MTELREERKPIDLNALAIWALGRSTGASAKCIARHALGLPTDGSYPVDGGDFGRCEALMDAVPGMRERLVDMAGVNRQWAVLVASWEEIRTSPAQCTKIQSILRREQLDYVARCIAAKQEKSPSLQDMALS